MTLARLLLASTAISLTGLGMSHAAPLSPARSMANPGIVAASPVIRVQMSVADAEAALAAALQRLTEAQASGGDVAAAQADVAAAQAELSAAQSAAQPAPEPAPEAAPQQEAPPPAPEPEPAPEAAPEPAPEAAPEPAPEPAPEAAPEPEPAPEAAPAPEPAPEAAPEQQVEPTPEAAPEPTAEQPPVEEAAPEAPEPDATDPGSAVEEAPAAEAPAQEETTPEAAPPEAPADAQPEAPAAPEADSAPEPEAVPVPEPAPSQDGQATQVEQSPEESQADAPAAPEEPAATDAEEAPADAGSEPAAEPAEDAPASSGEQAPENDEGVLTLPVEGGAPVLDSAKEEPVEGDEPAEAPTQQEEPAAAPPASDQESQAPEVRDEAAPQALSEIGERLSDAPAPEEETNVTIINQIDNRTIIEVDNRTIIEHDERGRLRAGSEEVYYERLEGGRVREVIVRPNGVQLVTITNRWGDTLQRSRIMPDGREYVLFYARASSDGSRQAFVDPGRRLPPLRLQIPIEEYILDASNAEPSAYLEFLMEPPVEQVERLYSVEEVRRSARVRDKVRRIDLDSLTFEFGKASIAEDQIQRLSDLADAISRILEENPAETFLIEGHTDAVGTDNANLLLSDKRAETIAVALTDVFGIPPENLVTQGYGERYLKIKTESPERLNRRVTVRRITALVTPVASR